MSTWSTPKRALQMDNDDEFIALTPQDQTVVRAEFEADVLVKNLATPFHYDKSSSRKENHTKGIFHSLGMSDKLDLIHQETDDVVQGMLHNGNSSYASPKPVYKNHELFEKETRGSPQVTHYTNSSYSSQKLTPSQTSRCQDLFTAKDEIIQQKDIIMQKQKNIINQLRQRNMELEEQLIQTEQIQLKTTNYEHFHREHQQQIHKLRQEMNEHHARKCAEVEKLQRKLGEREYDIGKLNIALKEHQMTKENSLEKIVQEFEVNNQKLQVEKGKNEKLIAEMNTIRQENVKLLSYLEELPTSEEFKKVKFELKKISQEYDDLTESKEKFQRRYKEIKEEYIEKESEFKKLQRNSFELKEEISHLNSTLLKYRSNAPISIEDHESKLREISMMQKENKELRESLNKRQKKMTRLHYDYMGKQKESDVEKEKLLESIKSLKDDTQEKSISIIKLNARNQELLSSSLEFQTELKKYKEMYTDEYQSTMQALYTEMIQCIDDVKSFVNLCTSLSKGSDPSLHALLGLKDSPDKPCAVSIPAANDLTSLNQQYELIKGVRKEVKELRHTVSEQYAEQIGQNMCVTQ